MYFTGLEEQNPAHEQTCTLHMQGTAVCRNDCRLELPRHNYLSIFDKHIFWWRATLEFSPGDKHEGVRSSSASFLCVHARCFDFPSRFLR